MRPSEVTCLPADCCFSELSLSTSNSSHQNVTCSHHEIAKIIAHLALINNSSLTYFHLLTLGLQRLQEIFGSMPSYRDVRFTYRKLEDVDHAHEDLRTLDRMNTAEDKKIILDLSTFQAFTSLLRQVLWTYHNIY